MVLFDNTQKGLHKRGSIAFGKGRMVIRNRLVHFIFLRSSLKNAVFSEIAKISKWEANFFFLLIETTFGMYNNFVNYLELLEALGFLVGTKNLVGSNIFFLFMAVTIFLKGNLKISF